MRADRVEQVFVKRAGAGYELLIVLESAAGRRERVTVNAPASVARTERGAVEYLARWLRGRGAGPARLVRVRCERGGELKDAPELRDRLLEILADAGAAGEPEEGDAWD